jgi:hypothetical protein
MRTEAVGFLLQKKPDTETRLRRPELIGTVASIVAVTAPDGTHQLSPASGSRSTPWAFPSGCARRIPPDTGTLA